MFESEFSPSPPPPPPPHTHRYYLVLLGFIFTRCILQHTVLVRSSGRQKRITISSTCALRLSAILGLLTKQVTLTLPGITCTHAVPAKARCATAGILQTDARKVYLLWLSLNALNREARKNTTREAGCYGGGGGGGGGVLVANVHAPCIVRMPVQ